jgi:hypothetical protein
MGRQVRRVPKDWIHPRNEHGNYIPMFDRSYREAAHEWIEDFMLWQDGKRRTFSGEIVDVSESEKKYYFWDWSGPPPQEEDFRPDWPEETRTHLQMYEDCTEGTPISPVMEAPEELARWLADNNASSFGRMTATYDQWLATIKAGWAPSAIIDSGGMKSGVAHTGDRGD